MKFKLALIICFVLLGINVSAQETRYIEVTGSAEMLIQPDEFIFIIGIEEYWKEEFKKKKKFDDYKNKVSIREIEEQLLKDLSELGIKRKDVKSTEVGNYWRYRGKEFLISKKLEVSMTDFKLINEIISKLDRKGIDYMKIGELKNKNLVHYRKEVKKQALLAAKEKAKYLLAVIDKKLGNVISITELNSDNYFWRSPTTSSNVVMNSNRNQGVENEKKIKLRFEMKAKFEIK
ncbi:MAG: SIMPL domain-containing protein [Flavobacteriales bacterium]|nr:MAG: SIMPL domain-containing protein [Flavobacteriales bacterium]